MLPSQTLRRLCPSASLKLATVDFPGNDWQHMSWPSQNDLLKEVANVAFRDREWVAKLSNFHVGIRTLSPDPLTSPALRLKDNVRHAGPVLAKCPYDGPVLPQDYQQAIALHLRPFINDTMAVAATIDTIGLLASGLGIVQFGLDHIPSNPGPSGASLQIKAGQAANLTEAGGGIYAVYAYDLDNQYLGSGSGGDVADGGTFSTTIDQSSPDIQADFVGVTFTDDAVCVAWISVKMQDGSPGGAWTGDIGANCGEVWAYQTQTAGTAENQAYIPRCTWFDGDHTTGAHSSMKFRTRAYGEACADTIANSHQCDSTIYGVDNTPIDGQPAKHKRDTRIRPQWMIDQLIISGIPQHSAKDLCDSKTSWSADFIDAHGNFCDMGTKTLSPLCSAENVSGCVQVDGNSLVKSASFGRRAVELAGKDYAVVKYW
nr:hypothetical protein CFP56_12210 [Quercus suber]